MIAPPDNSEMQRTIKAALAEDIGGGDITSALTVDEDIQGVFQFVARESIVLSGLGVAREVFAQIDKTAAFTTRQSDGVKVEAGSVLATVQGRVRTLLAAERTALNLLQRMCGVATLTAEYVAAVQGTGAQILDTRKTMPGLRDLDKYAVRCGGGTNHRFRLDDAVLIKDNHIAACGGDIAKAVNRALSGAPSGMTVEVECDTLAQVQKAINAGATMLLLDNMTTDELREAVALAKPKQVRTEASGNVSLQTVRSIAETGVDFISVGKLTHSARAVDIGLDEG